MKRRTLDILSLTGLAVSLAAVFDMLCRWELAALNVVYALWGAAGAAGMVVVLSFRKVRRHVHRCCLDGVPFLVPRLVLAVLLFALGWYINGASTLLYGEGSAMVAHNGVRIFALLFTVVTHVMYFAFTRRKADEKHDIRKK